MYVSTAGAALVIEFVFQALHLVPHSHNARIVSPSIQLNCITILDIIFLALAGMLLVSFFRTAGPQMLRMMNSKPD